jgi:predicted DNA-binding transcriptional regulator YafY
MRADRLLSILLLLQVEQRWTARALAERLEVSERTILRDMEALCAAGVPVIANRGAGGGWRLEQEYRTDLTGLSPDEVRTLFFMKTSRMLRDLGLSRAADAAFVKLAASATHAVRSEMELTQERLHIDGAGWYETSETFPLLPIVQQAVWRGCKLQMTYRRADGTVSERLVNPLGIVVKGNVWYLVASHDGKLRSYRVSRIQQADMGVEPCERPTAFDLAAYWTQSANEFIAAAPRYEVTLTASADYRARLRRAKFLRIQGEEEPDAEGWTVMQVRFEDEREACDYLIRAGAEAEVLKPDALRARLRQMAEEIVGIYSR